MTKIRFFVFVIALSFLNGSSAWAAKTATVSFDEAPLFEKPDKKSKVVERLRNGSIITTANDPKEGFYRARTPTGASGYIPSEMVNFYAASERTQGVSQGTKGFTKVSFEVFGGLSLFKYSEANALIASDFNGIQNGLSFGGELGFWPTRVFGFILRAEYLSKAVIANESTTNTDYNIGATSLPIYLGINLRFLNEKKVSASLSLLPGYTLINQLTGRASALPASDQTVFSAKALSYLAKLDLAVSLTQKLFVFGEGGYRYSKSASITPTTAGAGCVIFQTSGAYVPISLNSSGPFFDGGLGLRF